MVNHNCDKNNEPSSKKDIENINFTDQRRLRIGEIIFTENLYYQSEPTYNTNKVNQNLTVQSDNYNGHKQLFCSDKLIMTKTKIQTKLHQA